LPREALGRVWHFCAEGMGQVDLTAASRKLLLMPLCHGIELGSQLIARPSRKQGRSIVLPFSTADHDLPSIEVDVLDADRERFEEAKAASIEELADEAKGRDEVPEQGEGVLPREDRGEVFGPAGAFELLEPGHFQVEDPFVEEEERAQRLVLRGRRGAARDCKLIQGSRDLFRTHLPWVFAAVEVDELPDPVDVRLFGAWGVMQASDGGAYGFDEGHVDGPGCVGAVRRTRIGTYRRGAGASCGDPRIFRPGTGRPNHGTVGTNLAPRGVRSVRGLATGIRGYAAAVYLRRCADRPRKTAAYLREYEDKLRKVATYPREYGDKARRFTAYMREHGDRPCGTTHRDVGPRSLVGC